MTTNKIKIIIDIDELVWAFENSSVSQHYFIDTKENEIIHINEELDEDVEEKLEEMANERYIVIPERMPSEDINIMKSFLYYLEGERNDISIINEFHYALDRRKPFRNFKELLNNYPKIKEQWFKYKENKIKDEIIDWLFVNNIELEHPLIPNIKIKELTKEEILKLPSEITDFMPLDCMDCGNEEGIKARYFVPSVPIENAMIDEEIKNIMKNKYKIENFGVTGGGEIEGDILTYAECHKCGSYNIFWDF